MTARFKTIALFGRPQTDGLAEILDQIAAWLKRRGVSVLTQTNRSTRALQSLGRLIAAQGSTPGSTAIPGVQYSGCT